MRTMDVITCICDVITTIYPVIKDILAARQKKADRCGNTDQLDKS